MATVRVKTEEGIQEYQDVEYREEANGGLKVVSADGALTIASYPAGNYTILAEPVKRTVRAETPKPAEPKPKVEP